MINFFSKIQEYGRRNPVLMVIFIVSEIIVVVLLVISFQSLFTNPEGVSNAKISRIKQEIKDLPEDSVKVIQAALYDTIVINQNDNFSLSDSAVQIRQESIVNQYFEDINMHYVNFIVDIPSIEQTYQIFREWSDDGANKNYLDNRMTLIMCPTENQVIYPNFSCLDRHDHHGQNFIVSKFIAQLNNDFNDFSASVSQDLSSIGIIPLHSGEVTAEMATSYIERTKESISSLGISPEIFQYYVHDSTNPSDTNYSLNQ